MNSLISSLRSLSCYVFCKRVYDKEFAGGYFWMVSVQYKDFPNKDFPRWCGSFRIKTEAERFLRYILSEVSHA